MNTLTRLLTRIVILFLIFLGAYFFYRKFSNTPEAPVVTVIHHTLVQEITALGRLELVSYHFKDVVEYNKEQTSYKTLNYFLPAAKAVLIVSGEAIGCIDLTKIRAEDILQKTDTVIITLPKPELCLYKIDHQKSKVYDVTKGYFLEQGQMVSDAYKEAESKMKQSALEMGILEETNTNAQKILVPLVRQLSGKNVVLKTRI